MEDELLLIIEDTNEKMEKAIQHLEFTLSTIRAGKADPNILHAIVVDYYGTVTPLSQVSNINTPDSTTISIQPWEKSMIDPIERAIMAANIGITPVNNGEVIRLNIPPLTEERRKELTKRVRNEGENTKVSIRTTRRDANEELKILKKNGLPEDMEKDGEAQIQQLTDKYSKKIDELIAKKEKDIMTV